LKQLYSSILYIVNSFGVFGNLFTKEKKLQKINSKIPLYFKKVLYYKMFFDIIYKLNFIFGYEKEGCSDLEGLWFREIPYRK